MTNKMEVLVNEEKGGFAYLDGEVEKFSQAREWNPSLDFKVRLILEEIVLNALNYGGENNEALVTVLDESPKITLTFVDRGMAFNPLEDAKKANTTASVEERSIGGLGVHLVKKMASELTYNRKNDKNYLTVVLLTDD